MTRGRAAGRLEADHCRKPAADRDRAGLPSRFAPARLSSDRRDRRVRRGGRIVAAFEFAAGSGRARVGSTACASSAAGLFAFIVGGADIKRLHRQHAAQGEGLQSALLAQTGVEGLPHVLRPPDGFTQKTPAFGRSGKPRAIELPPDVPYAMTDCYVKPYACCRHIQPAVEALINVMAENNISAKDVRDVQVETYSIAAEHARTGWQDYASAQLLSVHHGDRHV